MKLCTYLAPFWDITKYWSQTVWDKSNYSVICTLFKITFLGKWEVGWTWRTSIPLVTRQFPRSPHIICAFCPVLSLLLIWTVLQGPHQDLRLCDLLSDGWQEQPLNEVLEALSLNILVQFLSILHHGTSLHDTLSTCLRFVKLQSSFRQSLTGCIADVAGTFESLIWLSGKAAWNFLLSSLLQILRTCLPAAAVYQLWAFSVPGLQFLISVLIFAFFFPHFPDCCKSHQRSISCSFATWRIQSFLWLLPAWLTWYLSRDLGLPHPVQPPVP